MGSLRKGRQFLYATGTLIALAFFVTSAFGNFEHSGKPAHPAQEGYEHDSEKEFIEFCERQRELQRDPDIAKRGCKRIHEKDFTDNDLRMLFTLFVIILWGALVRTMLRIFKLSIPYTVIQMFSGIVVGLAAKYKCYDMYTFTALARIKPEVILFTFLPVLIFETAFGISSYVFIKATYQILLAALPGMVISTVLTAMLCYQFFSEYDWTFLQALFYGSIISATDPVAVVAILKELGVSESLAVIIDGESLLNDAVAILLFEILKDLLKEEGNSHETSGQLAGRVVLMFIRIAIGGPVFGFLAAKVSIFCLARIFNDAIVEITITLVSAYLTYYLAEDVLGVSGVCAVVLLGLTISSEKTCISPEIIEEVNEFWELLSHLANTVLFFLTGIIIAERGSRDLTLVDVYYLILLYFALNFIRFAMLLILTPFLSRLGYGMTWQNLVVMVWGGLRGAVGICLSLQVYEDTTFCDDTTLGPKVLFQTAGVVLLTLTVNGTTTKKLLDILQLTAVSAGRIEEMQIAVKHLMDTQKKGSAMMKHDRYLADANWDYINKFTQMDNPYKNLHVKNKKPKVVTSILSVHADSREHECPQCHSMVENEPSNEEYRIMTEEARLRVLKALKISYWTQFEQGILTDPAVKTLASMADNFSDMELIMLHTKDLKKYWAIRGFVPWLRGKMVKQFGAGGKFGDRIPPKPPQRWRYPFWWMTTRSSFDTFMTVVVLSNMIPAIWEFSLDLAVSTSNGFGHCDRKNPKLRKAFRILNWIYLFIYVLEFLMKIIGRGCRDYWTNRWNYLDFIVIPIGIVDVIFAIFSRCASGKDEGITKIIKGLRFFRIIRIVRLVKPLIPCIMGYLNSRINQLLFFGYDIAVGHLWAIDDVLKYINQMIENPNVARKIQTSLEKDRLEAVREIGLIQREHPGITIAVKTRHASRSVLNQMKNALHDLRMDGLLDEKENMLLTIELEERMKRLWSSPNYIAPESPSVLVDNLAWVYGNNELKDFIFSNATLCTYDVGDVIVSAGDVPTGIYVIISGLVKIAYEPKEEKIALRAKYGVVPNMEIFRDFDFDKPVEDLFSTGTVLGESGVLTKRVRSATVTCETDGVSTYFIPMSIMDHAMAKFNTPYDSLEVRLWRSCGIRRSTAYLPTTSFYQSWPLEKIRIHVERSCVPLGPQFNVLELPEYVLDVFVIEGIVEDYMTGEEFVAPCLVARACTKILSRDNPKTKNRLLLITQDNIGIPTDDLGRCVVASYNLRRGGSKKKNDDSQDKKFTFHLNFSARQKKRRKTNYNADDDKNEKDGSIRRRSEKT